MAAAGSALLVAAVALLGGCHLFFPSDPMPANPIGFRLDEDILVAELSPCWAETVKTAELLDPTDQDPVWTGSGYRGDSNSISLAADSWDSTTGSLPAISDLRGFVLTISVAGDAPEYRSEVPAISVLEAAAPGSIVIDGEISRVEQFNEGWGC